MTSTTVTVTNQLGMHARAAAKFVQLATTFGARIRVECGPRAMDGKSILGLLLLAATRGASLTIVAEGDDEVAAVAALAGLVASEFGEGAWNA